MLILGGTYYCPEFEGGDVCDVDITLTDEEEEIFFEYIHDNPDETEIDPNEIEELYPAIERTIDELCDSEFDLLDSSLLEDLISEGRIEEGQNPYGTIWDLYVSFDVVDPSEYVDFNYED